MNISEKHVALKELEYQIHMMLHETQLKIQADQNAMATLSEGGVSSAIVEISRRRYMDRIHKLEEELAVHQGNLETVHREFAEL